MVLLWFGFFGLSALSALLPFLPIEGFIIGSAAAESGWVAAVALGVAAGGGATVGKVVWYKLGERGIETEWARKRLEKPKLRAAYETWVTRLEGRPVYAGAVMFIAAWIGLPPLLALSLVAGILKMPMWVFVPTVFVGRSLRFGLLFLGADFFVL